MDKKFPHALVANFPKPICMRFLMSLLTDSQIYLQVLDPQYFHAYVYHVLVVDFSVVVVVYFVYFIILTNIFLRQCPIHEGNNVLSKVNPLSKHEMLEIVLMCI